MLDAIDYALEKRYESGVVDGERKKRERIIKLLETHTPVASPYEFVYCSECGGGEVYVEHLIALIKGEQK